MSSPTSTTPVPERSLNQQLVLDEDEYTEALSHIIARDFFPSLLHLGATNSYLDALHSQDPQLINASVRRLQEISSTPTTSRRPFQTPSQTPYGAGPSETPIYAHQRGESGEAPPKRARFNADLGLDAFQARYTSEDNSSFTQILDDENRKRREKWAWAWEAQKRVEAQRDRMLESRERMMIEPARAAGVTERFVIEAPKPAGLITEAGEALEEGKDGEVVEDEGKGKALALMPELDKDDPLAPTVRLETREAGVDGWKFKTRNSLMFVPDADVSPYHPANRSGDDKSEPKVIKHTNTRLPSQMEGSSDSRSLSCPPSPTRSRIDAAIAGTPYRPRSPTINNFSYVPNLPSPTPSELGPAAVKQLMTWGTLNATPRVIAQDDGPVPTPSTPFHIPAPSSREVIGQKLSNSASRSLRAKAGMFGLNPGRSSGIGTGMTPGGRKGKGKGNMAPPTWTPRRAEAVGSLTPAARRLLDRTTGTAAARRAQAMEQAAGWGNRGREAGGEQDLSRVKWTPTPGPAARQGRG